MQASNRTGTQGEDRSARLLVGLCAFYVAAAVIISPADYLSLLSQYAAMFLHILPAVVLLAVATIAMLRNPASPASEMRTVVNQFIAPAAVVLIGFLFFIAAFTTFKANIPRFVPFYADPYLADIGQYLHGDSPWQILHRYAPDWIGPIVDVLYSRVWFMEWFGVLAFVAFWHDEKRRLRYLWAFALTMMICGTALATALSSVGPVFYDAFFPGGRYSGLIQALDTSPDGAQVLGYAAYLFDSLRSNQPTFGTGISAMPSMHVAIAVLNAWFLSSRSRYLGLAGWAFAAAILFGSVYTGWHYALDGYASIIVVSVIWWATGRSWSRTPSRQTMPDALPA